MTKEAKKRVVSLALGLALAFGVVACDDDEGPITTPPGSPDTTEPVGS